MDKDVMVTLSRGELEVILSEAATQGARKALKEVGLEGDTAPEDIKELRHLLTAWRSAKSTMGKTILQIVTTAVLVFISVAVFMKLGINVGD
tara:strand:- start:4903 stop:5178 length:276 start_codon:yes stop_codon:yes gene_type:complete